MKLDTGNIYDIQSHRRAEWSAACKGMSRDADGDS